MSATFRANNHELELDVDADGIDAHWVAEELQGLFEEAGEADKPQIRRAIDWLEASLAGAGRVRISFSVRRAP